MNEIEMIKAEIERRDLDGARTTQVVNETVTISPMQEGPVSEDMDIAASEYVSVCPDSFVDWIGNHGETDDIPYIIKAFKAGAQWKEQQMMEKAVDGECSLEMGDVGTVRTLGDFKLNGLHCGDKVKLIIIKDE